jgi:transketolase
VLRRNKRGERQHEKIVVAPADEVEVRQAMGARVAHRGPPYLRLTRDPFKSIFDDNYRFVPGQTVTLREGDDVTLIGTGEESICCLEAGDLLATEGISAVVLHVPTLKPIDAETIFAPARRTRHVATAEDHTIIGGLAPYHEEKRTCNS